MKTKKTAFGLLWGESWGNAQSLRQSCSHGTSNRPLGRRIWCANSPLDCSPCGTARGTLPPPPRSKVAATVGPPAGGRRDLFVIPRVVFNDDGLTLDDMSLKDMEKEAGVPLAVVSCNPSEFLPEIEALARHLAARA